MLQEGYSLSGIPRRHMGYVEGLATTKTNTQFIILQFVNNGIETDGISSKWYEYGPPWAYFPDQLAAFNPYATFAATRNYVEFRCNNVCSWLDWQAISKMKLPAPILKEVQNTKILRKLRQKALIKLRAKDHRTMIPRALRRLQPFMIEFIEN